MKILHLGKYYLPNKGGIETATKQILENNDGKFQSTLVHFGVENFEKQHKKYKQICCKVLIKLFSQPLSVSYFYKIIKEAPKNEIIHIHAPNPIAYLAIFFAKLTKKNRILIHWHSDIIKKGFIYWLIKPIERYILNKSIKIIVATNEYAKDSFPLKNYQKKITIIPYSIKPTIISSRIKKKYFNKYKSLYKKNIILFVGRFVNYKGINFLINSAKYIQDNSLILIAGSGDLGRKLKKTITKNSNKILLINQPSDEEINYLYSMATIFCLPSINKAEAFGIVLIEAMSHGLPLVTFKIRGSGVNFINQNNVTGRVVDKINGEDLADSINKILNSTTLLNKYSTNSKERFKKLFSEEIFVRNIHKTYKNIL